MSSVVIPTIGSSILLSVRLERPGNWARKPRRPVGDVLDPV